MKKYKDYILVFDSGLGDISILQGLVKELPYEKFVYFGDSANAPYGDKTAKEIADLTLKHVDHFIKQGVKAVVIACNTATAAAAPILRGRYIYTPIICVEPAIKQASIEHPTDDILVMATSATLKLEKFNKLKDELSHRAKIISLPCSGLVDLIEQGNLSNPQIKQYLVEKITPYKTIKAIVLGCTHYPFIEKQIKSIMPQTDIYNSTTGTAMELRRQLIKAEILNKTENIVSPVFLSSSNNVELMQKFFESK
ncbi:glutamate racemase [Candidatus Saccharibacteria bacterium]|nr:glutamate racemase [Candidatus Saccharibacteria bacterium]